MKCFESLGYNIIDPSHHTKDNKSTSGDKLPKLKYDSSFEYEFNALPLSAIEDWPGRKTVRWYGVSQPVPRSESIHNQSRSQATLHGLGTRLAHAVHAQYFFPTQ